MKCVLIVVATFLTEARMLKSCPTFGSNQTFPREGFILSPLGELEGGYGFYYDFLRVGQSQGQFIAMNPQFHRVAEGCIFLQRNLRAGYHTHVEEMLPKCSLTTHIEDGG